MIDLQSAFCFLDSSYVSYMSHVVTIIPASYARMYMRRIIWRLSNLLFKLTDLLEDGICLHLLEFTCIIDGLYNSIRVAIITHMVLHKLHMTGQ